MEHGKEVRRVNRLWIYPIKSCGGIEVDRLVLDDRGPLLDRRWMLVDADGTFMTQREHPRMTLIDVAAAGEDIVLSAPGMTGLRFPLQTTGTPVTAVVWRDTLELETVSPQADAWFSDFLGVRCRLLRMPASTHRVVNPVYSPATRLVSLADGYPLMLITTGSLDLLNEKLTAKGAAAVPMQRFRPNIEVLHQSPHAEDEWRSVRIGAVACDVVKPCERCAIPTVDTRTGVAGKEPLRTLGTYRKVGSKVMFGQNLIHAAPGEIRVGDEVFV